MKRTIFAATAAFSLLTGAQAAEKLTIDSAHSHVLFKVNHLGFASSIGEFRDFSGFVEIDQDEPSKSRVEATIQVGSIDTNHSERDNHLKSADFFDAASYPTITFKSTEVGVYEDGKAKVTGDLTLHGVTKPVTLDVTLNKLGENPIRKNYDLNPFGAGFSATGVIKRSDFGIDAYVPAVSDEVTITIETEAYAS